MSNATPAAAVRRVVDPVKDFLQTEAAGGLFLLAATVVALGWANSPFAAGYEGLWSTELTIGAGPLAVTEDLKHWVNDGLMALFFFVFGLEIKRELVVGELREPRRANLPVLAALGGVVVPAGIFLLLNAGGEGGRGWGIPMATDIAFAVGVLAVLGSRVPTGAKVFLLTLAIVDDILAITVIAVFYTGQLAVAWLAVAAAGMVLVLLLRQLGVRAISAYVPLGVLVWLATLESGVHATIAGVALGLATPARPAGGRPVLEQLEHRLHPLSSYVVIPLFALANAGVSLGGDALGRAARSPVALGCGPGAAGRQDPRSGRGQPGRGAAAGGYPARRPHHAPRPRPGRAGRDRLHGVAVHRRPRLSRQRPDRPRQGRHPGRIAGQRPGRCRPARHRPPPISGRNGGGTDRTRPSAVTVHPLRRHAGGYLH
jgi:NhaA family Na+:H+ antiporter